MKEKVKETLAGLKDFQLKTVEYVFEQLYKNRRSKMLIADEVGLGKTIVAKGIIAKAFDRFRPTIKKSVFNVVYICSNQALAKQNLSKLNFTGDPQAIDYSDDDDRLTSLAYISPKEERQSSFRIKAFTPATSFDVKTQAGKADERILLYRLLFDYSDMGEGKNSLKWILKGTRIINDDTWENRIWAAEQAEAGRITSLRKIRPRVYSEFRKALAEEVNPEDLPKSFEAAGLTYPVKYWTLIKRLCQLGIRKNNYYNYKFNRELISSLRFLLSKVCIEFLEADIFILDEFQRYKQLIDGAGGKDDENEKLSPAIEIAREIFSFGHSKILMLSATPFKPYTNDFDELNGEIHYNEFKTVLQFLMPEKSKAFWQEYEMDRRTFFSFLRHPDTLAGKIDIAHDLKNKLEALYKTGIVRTEKLLASDNRDALIKHVQDKPITVHPEDINDFVVLDQITLLLNKEYNAALSIPLEYVKSSPYALSFLDHYQHKEKIRELALGNPELKRLLKKTKNGWVNLEDIGLYKPLIPARGNKLPNAKLRLLLDETVLNGGWKYLWIPPSIPYYELGGAFKDSWGYSKTLIFSSWKMVPRMISSLVSYEAERLSVGNRNSISEKEKVEDKREYFQKRRTPRPQFTFKVDLEAKEPAQMNNFILTYPSLFLANLYDPASNIADGKDLKQIKKDLHKTILALFKKRHIGQIGSERGDWQKWYWVAPLILDRNESLLGEWFVKGIPQSELSMDVENLNSDRGENSGKGKHFEYAHEVFQGKIIKKLPRLREDQLEKVVDHLVELTLASPAVCFLRSLLRHKPLSLDCLDASYNVASAFLTMFNKPESIAVVRLHTTENEYAKRTLQYMMDGNIQAMLDEFIYLLIKGENFQSIPELSDFVSEILSVRTASTEVDDLKLFISNLDNDKPKRVTIRSHYAVDFGNQKISSAKSAGRQINIRQAFNSPFRPFVLASTSIGQEGLDFHFYCKKIFHWNLPSNPIDFEQREGRIHRYQGLVIRLNLADKYRSQLHFHDSSNDIWKELFKVASKEKETAKFNCDLVPFWHTESNNDIKIERFVPLYPFSRDEQKFSNLIKILTFYRLTFGQPRQEELIDALDQYGFDKETIQKLDELMINLSPIRFL